MHKHFSSIAAVAALALMGVDMSALASAPQVRTQAPGYSRVMLGAFEITALYDTGFKLATGILRNASPAQLQHLLSQGFLAGPKAPATLMAYLVNTGSNLVLVDTGCGHLHKPSVSYLLENLRAAGYQPAQVDTILITHMHGDHVAGLVDEKGAIVFPNAKVHVSQLDCDFWLSQKIARAAPDAARHFFVNAQASAAPYIASGQAWA